MISVYTPSHTPRFLDECWASLREQTHDDFEWIVVLNGGARWTIPPDPRIRVAICDELRGVGAAKSYACAMADGDILVELDHDDILVNDALAIIQAAFNMHPDVGFVYSDGAQILEDGSKDESTWRLDNGWHYHEEVVTFGVDETVDHGDHYLTATLAAQEVLVVDALEPTPHNVSFIWFAPNHVRAFRRDAYEKAGGYDPDRDILDDQDLMCRLYQATEFFHVPRCLYLQRVHNTNTQKVQEINDGIQRGTVSVYDGDIQANALAWAGRRDLKCLDLGGSFGKPEGYLSV